MLSNRRPDTVALRQMRWIYLLFLLCSVTLPAFAGKAASDTPIHLYVATDGSDEWDGSRADHQPGTRHGPLATLKAARDMLRKRRKRLLRKPGAIVEVAGGTYHLAATLELTELDSGRTGAPVLYRSSGDQPVILSGGRSLQRCKYVDTHMLRCALRLDDLPPGGQVGIDIRLDGPLPPFEVFAGDTPLQLARWPNRHRTLTDAANWLHVQSAQRNNRHILDFDDSALPDGIDWTGVVAHVWPNDWYDQYLGIADMRNGRIVLNKALVYPVRSGIRFSLLNFPEALDAPGEWYYSPSSRELTIHTAGGDGVYSISRLDSVLSISKARYVRFEGFIIEQSRGNAVDIDESHNIRLSDCVVRNSGGYGINIRKGSRNRIERCEVHETGYGGILLSGGDRKSLQPSRHLVVDNHIHHTTRLVRNGRAAINVYGVGSVIRRNEIHSIPSTAVQLIGNDHLLELNNIHHACELSADCGAVYSGRDWSFRGNVIRHNRIHSIFGYGLQARHHDHVVYTTPNGGRGVYLDDGASGFVVHGNLLYDIPEKAVQIGGGRDNEITNNVFVVDRHAIWMDARSKGFPWEKVMLPRLESMPYRSDEWRRRYPRLAEEMRHRHWPEGNRIRGNIVVGTGVKGQRFVPFRLALVKDAVDIDRNIVWDHDRPVYISRNLLGEALSGHVSWDDWQREGFDINGIHANPLLSDLAGEGPIPLAQSPAWPLGFEKIPTKAIPPTTHTFRQSTNAQIIRLGPAEASD